eukprot:TRINITY_DN2431_c0_g1_i1.p3 TRINITY_DN2431_c0_g1~~TRINITY_DN2431_c0_g1_i1.p3  ORF type:complete len:112 (-),score=11.13 TRINITY_DN2431_c0_g1_i1:183-518(-)
MLRKKVPRNYFNLMQRQAACMLFQGAAEQLKSQHYCEAYRFFGTSFAALKKIKPEKRVRQLRNRYLFRTWENVTPYTVLGDEDKEMMKRNSPMVRQLARKITRQITEQESK